MENKNFPHDASYKAFFSDRDMMKSLLADFLPADLIQDFELDTLEPCSGTYVTDELSKRQNDIVWRLKYKDGWCYIYILLEFQSTQDPIMALRILTYTALLWEDLIKNGTIKKNEKLPPVLPIVLYNGESRWTAYLNINELVESVPDPLADFQPSQKYLLIDENRINEFILDKAPGNSAFIFRIERAKSGDEILDLLHELKGRIGEPLLRVISSWVRLILKNKGMMVTQQESINEEVIPMLEHNIERWKNELVQKGIRQGEEIGFSKGEAKGIATQKATLLEMIKARFGEIPASWQNTINNLASSEGISQLTINILKVKSADEYGQMLMGMTKVQ